MFQFQNSRTIFWSGRLSQSALPTVYSNVHRPTSTVEAMRRHHRSLGAPGTCASYTRHSWHDLDFDSESDRAGFCFGYCWCWKANKAAAGRPYFRPSLLFADDEPKAHGNWAWTRPQKKALCYQYQAMRRSFINLSL